jgi:predicted acetyltransferase
MEWRIASQQDLDLLAEWNLQLIHDEGHSNPMSVAELRQRMQCWLQGEYTAIIFSMVDGPAAYALYCQNETEIHLRQFFVARELRRRGIGRQAFTILRQRIWTQAKRLTVEVLVDNTAGLAFWRAMGYRDYCLTLEIPAMLEEHSAHSK